MSIFDERKKIQILYSQQESNNKEPQEIKECIKVIEKYQTFKSRVEQQKPKEILSVNSIRRSSKKKIYLNKLQRIQTHKKKKKEINRY